MPTTEEGENEMRRVKGVKFFNLSYDKRFVDNNKLLCETEYSFIHVQVFYF